MGEIAKSLQSSLVYHSGTVSKFGMGSEKVAVLPILSN